MNNLDYWQTFVGDQSPEEFMRAYGAMEPELSVTRFLEERGHLYGVVNQGSWVDTFQASEQHHQHTVRMYLLSYLDETREKWGPALEAKPPSVPRRYREKFDQDKYPPPPAAEDSSEKTPGEAAVGDATPPDGEAAASEAGAEEAGSAIESEKPGEAAVGEATPPDSEAAASETGAEEAGSAIESEESGEMPASDEAATEGAEPSETSESSNDAVVDGNNKTE